MKTLSANPHSLLHRRSPSSTPPPPVLHPSSSPTQLHHPSLCRRDGVEPPSRCLPWTPTNLILSRDQHDLLRFNPIAGLPQLLPFPHRPHLPSIRRRPVSPNATASPGTSPSPALPSCASNRATLRETLAAPGGGRER